MMKTDMTKHPNIIYFFVDDMGYGDVSCLNPEGKIQTPNIDRLAGEGMTFTDAEAAAEGLPLVQLYDLRADPGEQHNLQAKHPDRVRAMVTQLKQYVADGRSTPGAKQQNDTEVDVWKIDTLPAVDPAILDDY